MVPDLDAAKLLVEVSDAEAELLQSSRRPILLLRRLAACGVANELAPGNLNEKLLRELAGATESVGGKFYRENDLKDLPEQVKGKTVNLNPPPRKEVLLWTQWYVLAGVIGLLTV